MIKFYYIDVHNAMLDTNKGLDQLGAEYRFRCSEKWGKVTIFSIDQDSGKEEILYDGVERDEAMRFFQGTNTILINL